MDAAVLEVGRLEESPNNLAQELNEV